MKKVGLLGGSFDPIHLGHLNLAIELKEKWQLEEVWFIPAQVSPFKKNALPSLASHRLKMVELALKPFSQFFLSDFELQRPSLSYTIETVNYFCQLHRENRYFWLIGEDHLNSFTKWYQWQEILKQVTLLIGSRFQSPSEEANILPEQLQSLLTKGWTRTRLMDISSTDIRMRLIENLPCDHLLPNTVLTYIEQNQLYQLKECFNH